MRDRAQQSWPALPNTEPGADDAAFSRSASANITLADLPPSSSVTRLMVFAAGDRNRLAVMLVDGAGVEVEDIGDHAHLPARVGEWLAGVGGLQPRQLLAVLLHERRDAAQQASTIGGLHGAPRGKGSFGG